MFVCVCLCVCRYVLVCMHVCARAYLELHFKRCTCPLASAIMQSLQVCKVCRKLLFAETLFAELTCAGRRNKQSAALLLRGLLLGAGAGESSCLGRIKVAAHAKHAVVQQCVLRNM